MTNTIRKQLYIACHTLWVSVGDVTATVTVYLVADASILATKSIVITTVISPLQVVIDGECLIL